MSIRVDVLDGVTVSGLTRGQVGSWHARQRVFTLLELLVWAGREGLPTGQLTRRLWDTPPAEATLHKSVQRARQLLGEPRALRNHRGRYALNSELVASDLWDLERQCGLLMMPLDCDGLAGWAGQVAQVRPPFDGAGGRLRDRALMAASVCDDEQVSAALRDAADAVSDPR